jgi:hypothetical protein
MLTFICGPCSASSANTILHVLNGCAEQWLVNLLHPWPVQCLV